VRTENSGDSVENNLSGYASSVEYHAKIRQHIPHNKMELLERMNITLMEKERSMLSGARLCTRIQGRGSRH
jgi:hypothetical protein